MYHILRVVYFTYQPVINNRFIVRLLQETSCGCELFVLQSLLLSTMAS